MIEGLLSDVHGVLYTYPHAIAGSVEAVRRLEAADFPHLFLTNSTQHSKSWVLGTLRDLGFSIPASRMMTAAEAAGDVLLAKGYRRIGWLCVQEIAEDIPEVEAVPPTGDERVDAVLVGDMGDGFTYDVLNRAFRWLHDGAALIALARNRYYQGPDGLVLDSGPYVRLLEDAAETRALIIGKPSPDFFRAGLRRLGLPPERAAMVGDDLDGDILPAMALGMRGILAMTGKFRRERYRAAAAGADELVPDLAALVETLLRRAQ